MKPLCLYGYTYVDVHSILGTNLDSFLQGHADGATALANFCRWCDEEGIRVLTVCTIQYNGPLCTCYPLLFCP